MKSKIYNYDNIKESDITDRVIRVKALMVNSNNEILLGQAFGTVQFPGGHLKMQETFNQGLIREVKEETGITLKGKFEPFFAIKYYLKDFPNKNNNRSIEIYYYRIDTYEVFDLTKISLDNQERKGGFKLEYVSLKMFNKYLKSHLDNNPFNKLVSREMKLAMREYKKIRGKNGKQKI